MSSAIILNAFLRECPSEERRRLMECLVPAEREKLEKLPSTFGDPLQSVEDPEKLLAWIHSSWITPFLRTLSEKEIGIFLGALPVEKVGAVGKDLLFKGKVQELSALGKSFIQATLARYLTAEVDDLLPIVCLPESPLNELLSLPLEVMAQFLDLLGMHDVAVEMKQIIDKHKLQRIEEALAPEQLTYLKMLMQSHEPVAFTHMGLINWSGEREKLKMLIRQRGANRLAKALYGADASLHWYVLHRLDVEKALIVRKLATPIDNPRAQKLLIQQITELTHYIQKGEKA